MAELEEATAALPARVIRLEGRMDVVEDQLADLRQAIRDSEIMLSGRIDNLGNNLGGKVDSIRNEVYQALITAARNVTPTVMWVTTGLISVLTLVAGFALSGHF